MRGPSALVRSLTDGLKKIKYPFNTDPLFERNISQFTHVLSHPDTLSLAIKLKEKGIIKHLSAGPNIVVHPDQIKNIIDSKIIETYLVPSKWTYDYYLPYFKDQEERLKIWYAGVDTNHWKPNQNQKKNIGVIYYKTKEETILKEAIKILNEKNIKYKLVEYGKYTHESFKQDLINAKFMICISRSESQGIFLAEAWSMDVPTLVWNPGYAILDEGKSNEIKVSAHSAPYLTNETGAEFKSENDIKTSFNSFYQKIIEFTPRDWVLQNMSDEISARDLINKIFNI